MKNEKQALLDIVELCEGANERRRNQVNEMGRELMTQKIFKEIKERAECALEVR